MPRKDPKVEERRQRIKLYLRDNAPNKMHLSAIVGALFPLQRTRIEWCPLDRLPVWRPDFPGAQHMYSDCDGTMTHSRYHLMGIAVGHTHSEVEVEFREVSVASINNYIRELVRRGDIIRIGPSTWMYHDSDETRRVEVAELEKLWAL